jgi:PEP-CTERM motif
MPLRQILRLLILSAGLLASAAQASLVTNGGFETGDFTGWSQIGPVPGSGNTVAGALYGTEPHSGSQQAVIMSSLDANGLSQILNTVAGQTYTVSFWLSNPSDCLAMCWFDFSWDGVSEFTSTYEPAFGYTQFTYQLQASSSSTLLQFYFSNIAALGIYLDDVSVEPVATAGTVPEPATLALALTALLGAAAASRRRRGC